MTRQIIDDYPGDTEWMDLSLPVGPMEQPSAFDDLVDAWSGLTAAMKPAYDGLTAIGKSIGTAIHKALAEVEIEFTSEPRPISARRFGKGARPHYYVTDEIVYLFDSAEKEYARYFKTLPPLTIPAPAVVVPDPKPIAIPFWTGDPTLKVYADFRSPTYPVMTTGPMSTAYRSRGIVA